MIFIMYQCDAFLYVQVLPLSLDAVLFSVAIDSVGVAVHPFGSILDEVFLVGTAVGRIMKHSFQITEANASAGLHTASSFARVPLEFADSLVDFSEHLYVFIFFSIFFQFFFHFISTFFFEQNKIGV